MLSQKLQRFRPVWLLSRQHPSLILKIQRKPFNLKTP